MTDRTYRLNADLTVRDERTAGTGRVGVAWRRGQPAHPHVVDELGLDLLARLREPATPLDLARAAAPWLPPGRSGAADEALGEQLLARLTQSGFTESVPAGGGPSAARWFGPKDPAPYRPGWTPLRAPMDVVLSVTMACNLRCRHCGVSCGPDTARPSELTLAEVTALLEECDRLGVNELTLTGGEVSVRPDWHDILQATLGTAYAVVMISNGVRLSDADVAFLAAFTRAKREGFRVALSLDGATPESHGRMRGGPATFHRTVATARRLIERGVRVDFGMTLTPHSRHEMPRALELAGELGVTSMELHPVEIYGRAQQDHELWMPRREVRRQVAQAAALQGRARELGVALHYEAKRTPFTRDFLDAHGVRHETALFQALRYPAHGHDAGLVKACVDADGTVYPSEKAQGFPALALANIRDGGLTGAWDAPGWAFFRGGWSPEQLHQCRGCPIEDRCSTKTNRIIPHVSLGDPLAAMPECQALVPRWKAP